MNKFPINFTVSEKRKLWKAKISLRRLDEYSLQHILDAVKPTEDRGEDIREQFFGYVSKDTLGAGFASKIGSKPFAFEQLNKGLLGASSGMRTTLDIVSNNNKLYGQGLGGALELINRSVTSRKSFLNGFSPMSDLVGNPSSTPWIIGTTELAMKTSQSVLDAFKPINERLSTFTSTMSAMEILRRDTMPFAITGLTSVVQNLSGHTKLMGAVDSMLSQSLLHQDIFKKYEIGSLARELSANSVFERSHISGVGAALAAATSYTDLAQHTLGSFAWDNLGNRNGPGEMIVHSAQKEFLDVSASYGVLLRNINEKPNWIYDSPDIAKLPAQDYYIGSRILKIVSTEENTKEEADADIDVENTDTIRRYLPVIDSDLPDLWDGALQAMNSDNPDKIRHMITSLRELYNHVLNRLAPDNAVGKWDPKQVYYHEGRPTRRGRFMYICRNLEGSSNQFAKLLKTEIDATLAMIDLFQGGTHTIKSNYAPHELQFIRIKAETTLRTFLSLEFEINRKQ